MPFGTYFGDALKKEVEEGRIKEEVVNNSVYRILYHMFRIGIFDKPNPNPITNNVTSAKHTEIARNISSQTTVLLKN